VRRGTCHRCPAGVQVQSNASSPCAPDWELALNKIKSKLHNNDVTPHTYQKQATGTQISMLYTTTNTTTTTTTTTTTKIIIA